MKCLRCRIGVLGNMLYNRNVALADIIKVM